MADSVSKLSLLSKAQRTRMKLVAPVVWGLDHGTCRASWVPNTGNMLDDRLCVCHIIGRDVRHPEYDHEQNLILFRGFIHDMFDGRRPNFMGISHKEFQVKLLEEIFHRLIDRGLDFEFRWMLSLEYKIKMLGVIQ